MGGMALLSADDYASFEFVNFYSSNRTRVTDQLCIPTQIMEKSKFIFPLSLSVALTFLSDVMKKNLKIA